MVLTNVFPEWPATWYAEHSQLFHSDSAKRARSGIRVVSVVLIYPSSGWDRNPKARWWAGNSFNELGLICFSHLMDVAKSNPHSTMS